MAGLVLNAIHTLALFVSSPRVKPVKLILRRSSDFQINLPADSYPFLLGSRVEKTASPGASICILSLIDQ